MVGCGLARAETLTDGVFRVDYSGQDAELARRTLSELKRTSLELERRLPAGEEPIRVIICTKQIEFMRYAGTYSQTGVVGVAQPEAGIIAVKNPSLAPVGEDYFGTIRHELIHVLLARNVDSDNMPRWLNEGVTMTLSGEYRWESRLQIADMYLRGRIINPLDLNFALSAPGSEMQFGEAYAESLSMTRFLMERLGDDTFWAMLLSMRTQDFPDALKHYSGWAPHELFDAWRQSLWKLALVSTVVSGFSLFQIMAILALVAYWRARRRGKRIMEQWEQEAAAEGEMSDDEDYDPWDDDVDDEDDVRRW